MSFTQQVVTHAEWIAQGGWEPAEYQPDDDHKVIFCTTDEDVLEDGEVIHPAGTVVWASWAPPDVPVEDRLNPDHPTVK
jgi:hypothetical protein